MLCLSSGCNDAPDPVGASTQPSGDYGIVHDTTFYATSHSSKRNLLYTSSIDRFMLGKYQTYQAWACLKFSRWPDSLFGATITSAKIQLRPFYDFGSDTTLPLSIDVYRAKANLQSDSLAFDSLNINGSYYYTNIPINLPLTIQSGDTLCSISIDTAVVREWFISNTDTTDRNDGLVLKPTGVSNIIKGFYSCNASDTALQPTLYVSYVDTKGVAGTYIHKTGSSKYLGYADPNLFESATDSMMYVQNGVSYRGLLTFNTLSLPWPIIIHKSILQITLDSAASSSKFVPFTNDLLYGLSVGSNDKSDGSFFTLSEQLTNSSGQRVYQFNVEGMTSGWLKNTAIKKLVLSGFFESGSFDLFKFYGAGSTITQRPKIIITYSIKR
jgi:hypothetical protein